MGGETERETPRQSDADVRRLWLMALCRFHRVPAEPVGKAQEDFWLLWSASFEGLFSSAPGPGVLAG